MVTSILFDLDNTILDFNKAEAVALRKVLTEVGVEPTEEIIKRYNEVNLSQWRLLERGELTREQVKVKRYQLLFEEFRIDASPEETAQIYEQLLGIGHYFMDGAEELLDRLVEKYDLYLVTNGTYQVQKSRIKSAGLAKYFKGIFISEEIGFNKPSKEYFEACFARMLEFEPEGAVIVGDSLTSDIQGGKNAGIKTIWFNFSHVENDTEIYPDFEIQTLSELEDILELL